MVNATISDDVTMPGARPTASGRLHAGDEILGRYVVQAELGQGGMGVVYKCMDKVGGVEVAVKGLPPDVSHNADEMEEIRENFQLVCDLRHPAIAGVRTLERDEKGDYYLVMDVAHGVNLNRWMKQHRDDDFEVKRTLLAEMADALDYAHSRRVMHRDMKPENVMVDDDGHVRILDFGLAARIRTSMSRVSMRSTSMSGTPGYKSPEQWRGQRQDAAADQYSLGVIAYRMISGELPFDSDDLTILREAVLKEPMPEIPGVAPAVNRALAKALAKTPGERFASCSDFVAVLGGGKATGKSAAPTSRPTVTGPSRSTSAGAVVAAILTVLALAGGGFAAYRWHAVQVERDRQRQAEAERLRAEALAREEAARKAEEAKREAEEAKRLAAIKAKEEAERQKLRNVAIEFKERAEGAHKDANRRKFAEYPELAATLRSFNACYQSGLEAFGNGDYAAATNFFERTGADMRKMAAEQRELDAKKREADRLAEVRRKVATGGYDAGKGANGEEVAIWVSGREVNGRMTSDREGVWRTKADCPDCAGSGTCQHDENCTQCSGSGKVNGATRCLSCRGSGRIQRQQVCPQCSGAGVRRMDCSAGCSRITRSGNVLFQHGFVCSQCNGAGTVANGSGLVGDLAGAAIGAAILGKHYRPPPRSPPRVNCSRCGGLGGYQCGTCSGMGFVQSRCSDCGGSGRSLQSEDCSDCAGKGARTVLVTCSNCRNGKVTVRTSCSRCGGIGKMWMEDSDSGKSYFPVKSGDVPPVVPEAVSVPPAVEPTLSAVEAKPAESSRKKPLGENARRLVGFWTCDCNVTYKDDMGSRADEKIKGFLPVSSRIQLRCEEDGTVELSDSSGRSFGHSTGTWKYRHGMLIMDLKSDDGRAFRLSGVVNWRGDAFELHYDNGEFANMIRKSCESALDLNAVVSSYVDGQLEVSITTKVPNFKMGTARCSAHVFAKR